MNKGLLEKFSGAAAAYSVRLLNRSYTGPLLKIRRVDSVTSQDNGEIFVFPDNDGWISLDSKVVDPSYTSLATTLGGFLNLKGQPDKDIISSTDPQDAYVVVWKDQSGNANDASQTSTTAQPKLATAGVLVTENGKPTVEFDGSDDFFPMPSAALPSNINNASAFAVYSRASATSSNSHTVYSLGVPNVRWYGSYMYDQTDKEYFSYGSDFTVHEIQQADTFQHIIANIAGSTQGDARAFLDGTLAVTTSLQSATPTAGAIGASNNTGSNLMDGNIQELVIYHSDKSSNRTKIEEDINDAFNIYSVALSPTERSFLGKYPDAAAAYSVRNLTGKSKQPIVKVRRELGVDTDTEETIYADSTGFLDQSQLLNFVNEVNEDPRLPLDISEGYGYSLRVVKAGYTGPLIQVRESGGNTTKDIYADASGNINVETLKTFCGSNDGHVVKWYNQGGVDRTLEADAAANQPKIVEAGVVVRDTLNNVALKFTNAGNEFLAIQDAAVFDLQEQCIAMHFMSTALPASLTKRIIGVSQPSGETFDSSIRNNISIQSSSGSIILFAGGSSATLTSIPQTVNSPSILTFNFKGGDSSGTSNKTTEAATLAATNVKGLSVGGRYTATATPDMLVAEVIQYTSAQFDDNKNEIEASLNKHYQIYGDAYVSTWYDQSTPADDTYLLDSNPGAAAAYSLRKLRENYTGKAINIRRDSDQNHLDIGFTSSGELDVDAIINFCGGANGYVTTWYNQAFNSTNELLLDTTEGQDAEAAYSVRQLSSTATECMIIRRASDSKLRTIGFKDRDIDEAAIESFCKGTTCTVQTWKDQSGNGNDATAAASTNEPTIYTGGALVKENGRLAVNMGSNDYFDLGSLSAASGDDVSYYWVGNWVGETSNNNRWILHSDNSPNYLVPVALDGNTSAGTAGLSSVTGYKDGASVAVATRDNVHDAFTNVYHLGEIYGTTTTAFSNTDLGRYTVGDNFYLNGNIQEFIFYTSDKSSDRTSIESNINGYYGIYSTNNATQDTLLSQPQIYSSSTGLVTESGKPAVKFDGSGDYFVASSVSLTQAVTATTISKTNDSNVNYFFDGDDASNRLTQFQGSENDGFGFFGGSVIASSTKNTNQNLHFVLFNGASSTYHLNGNLIASGNVGSNSADGIMIGARYNVDGFELDGNMQELIFWDSDQSNNRLEIEGNINSHYRIYGSNDASQSTSTAQPKLVSAGRVILENGRPAVDFDGSNDQLQMSSTPLTSTTNYASFIARYTDTTVEGNLYSAKDVTNSWTIGFNRSVSNSYAFRFYDGTNNDKGGAYNQVQALFTQTPTASITTVYKNGVAATQAYSARSGVSNAIGSRSGSYYFIGTIQEAIFYNSDQSSNRTGIESNINSQFGIYWDGSKRGLLDSQPNAAAAYSVRALNSSYTGPVVEIRRDSDGTSTDIYATYNGDLDENAIETFCTGTTCTVSTWYDQSGSSNDATQGTALDQPTIYTSGQLVKENEKPAVQFDGSNDALDFNLPANIDAAGYYHAFHVVQSNDTNGIMFGSTVGTSPWYMISEAASSNTGISSGFLDVVPTNTYAEYYKNGSQPLSVNATRDDMTNSFFTGNQILMNFMAETSNGVSSSGIKIGRYGGSGRICEFKIQEMVVYQSDQSSNRTDIEENINSYYNIYSKLPGDRLLNKFPGAAAAYSLRVLDSLYTGPLVRVRRDSDGVHADVYPDFNREISIYSKVGVLASSTAPIAAKGTTSLKSFMNGADGFVAVWYDQAESNNASQGTATDQPKIYDGATTSLVTEGSAGNEKPAMQFGPGKSINYTGGLTNDTNFFGTLVMSVGGGQAMYVAFDSNNAGRLALLQYPTPTTTFTPRLTSGFLSDDSGQTIAIDTQVLITSLKSGSQAECFANGQGNGASTVSDPTTSMGGLNFGRYANNYFTGKLQECIFYGNDQSSNRNKIEADINNHYSIYAKQKKLLDAYGGAAAAYSLRRLNSLYTGPLVTIRRDSDNVEVNVYPDFEGNFSLNSIVTNVDETTSGSSQVGFSYTTPYATLAQFVKGNPNCFVVEWKDQSGNGNHATQTTGTSQPKIYDGTTGVVTENGKPAVEFTDDFMTSVQSSTLTAVSVFVAGSVTNNNDTSNRIVSFTYSSGRDFESNRLIPLYASATNEVASYDDGQKRAQFAYTFGTSALFTHITDASNITNYLNGSQAATTALPSALSQSITGYSIGRGGSSGTANMVINEIISYESDETADRTNIEDNINTFYNIYS